MRVLVTGGAGFVGSHFVKLLAARGDEAVVLDKLTYSGNRANLEGVPHEFHEGDIADASFYKDEVLDSRLTAMLEGIDVRRARS